MAEQPNDASRKSKAEGDRSDFQSTDEQSGGISNRSGDEETSSQQAVPSRGKTKCGPNEGSGDADIDMDRDDSRRSER